MGLEFKHYHTMKQRGTNIKITVVNNSKIPVGFFFHPQNWDESMQYWVIAINVLFFL